MVRNLQGAHPVNTRFFQRLIKRLLQERFSKKDFDLGVYIISVREMTRLNETFLQHDGSTDVITFDYSDKAGRVERRIARRKRAEHPIVRPDFRPVLQGEIFVCAEEAAVQARRFRTSLESELVRYLVHGILHLEGYVDSYTTARRQMKHEEDRLVRRMSRLFDFTRLHCQLRAKGCQAIPTRVAGRRKAQSF